MVLILNSTDPEAGLKVRRWREKCRREESLCFIIYEDEKSTRIEIRLPGQNEGFIDFASIYEKYGMVSSSGGRLTILGHYPHAQLEHDIQEVLKQPLKPFPHFEESADDIALESDAEQVAVAGFVRTLDIGPRPRLVFDPEEYEVITAAVLATAEYRPVNLYYLSAPYSFVNFPIDQRLEPWPRRLVQDWETKRGNYVWEHRFPDSINLSDGLPVSRTTCSRPGIVGKQAVLQMECGNLRGLVLMEKTRQQWKVVETSHDEDWGLAGWEYSIDRFESLAEGKPELLVPEFSEWSRYPLPFPCPPGEFVPPLSLEESHHIYDSVSNGLAPTEQSEFSLPLCDGRKATPSEILSEARRTFDVHLNSNPTRITDRLSVMGVPVILLNYDSSPSVSKLLAYWGRHYSLLRVDDTYAEPVAPTEEQQKTLGRLTAIFQRSDVRGISFGVTSSAIALFYFLPPGSALASTVHPTPFDHQGVVLIEQAVLDPKYFSFDRMLHALCAWGDPDGTYTARILDSAKA